MSKTLTRLSDGNGNKQSYADPANNDFQAQASFSTATLRNGTRAYTVGRLEAVARLNNEVVKNDDNDVGMAIPVVVKLSASAPVGTNLHELKEAAEAVFKTFIEAGGTEEAPTLQTSVFFPVVNTISVP